MLPDLHGPRCPQWQVEDSGRRTLIPPLRFNWVWVDQAWVYDDSHMVPMTFPEPLPDYTPDEVAKIEASQSKRAKQCAR